MNIGIIVHSHTGNTLSVAERIAEACRARGRTARVERITAVDEDPRAAGNVQLRDIPDVDGYHAVLFGAPVRGFSLSPVMRLYLSRLSSLEGKRAGCFVTQHFPRPWMGGRRAVGQMTRLCAEKGADVCATGIVNWSNPERERLIAEVAGKLSDI